MILSRLHKGTNNRLAYYSKNFVRYITPKVLLRNRLQKVLAELEKRPDKEYILRRVDYYNKMQGIVPQARGPQVRGCGIGLFLR